MKLGIIGRGPWGNVYARTLEGMGVDFWQVAGHGLWKHQAADGLIIATAAHSHYDVAIQPIQWGIPVLVEKPVCLTSAHAQELLKLAQLHNGIVFTGHTRLYSPAWREFKRRALELGVRAVQAKVGGPCKLDPWWDWGPHLVALCLDLGAHPEIRVSREPIPLEMIVNGTLVFDDPLTKPTALEVLLTEFMAAIERGEPDVTSLQLGVAVVDYLERSDRGSH